MDDLKINFLWWCAVSPYNNTHLKQIMQTFLMQIY